MKRNYTHYSDEERLSILREYYLSGMTPYHFSHSYGLSSPTVLISWLRKYESHPEFVFEKHPSKKNQLHLIHWFTMPIPDFLNGEKSV